MITKFKSLYLDKLFFIMLTKERFIFVIISLFIYNGVLSQSLNNNDSIQKLYQPEDTTMLTYNKGQYNKMVSKGDVYFSQKEFEKSKKMYQRAIRFQPKWDNTYSENRILEIDRILLENH